MFTEEKRSTANETETASQSVTVSQQAEGWTDNTAGENRQRPQAET